MSERELTNGINFSANRYRIPLEAYVDMCLEDPGIRLL